MIVKIFYSWQSDLPNNTNRGFIEDALEKAVKAIRKDNTITVEPVIDRDTEGVPGSPNIAETILQKIAEADIFVADVSIINSPPKGTAITEKYRFTPNPNVLFELGYALAKLGPNRVLLIKNTALADTNALPFDLKLYRLISYNCLKEQEDKASERDGLAKRLEKAIKTIITNIETERANEQAEAQRAAEEQSVAQVIRTIEEGNPNQQKVATQQYMKGFINQLKAQAPIYKEGEDCEQPFLDAIGKTTGLVVEFSTLTESIAQMGSLQAAQAMYKSFETLLDYCGPPRRTHGFSYRELHYYRFMTHELFVSFISCLIKEGQWELIAKLLSQEFFINNIEGGSPGEYPYGYLSQHVELFDLPRHAAILKERHSQEPLQSIVPLQAFMEADYLLYLRSSVSNVSWKKDRDYTWRPRCVTFEYHNPPRFLQRMEKESFVQELLPVLDVNDIATLKTRLSDQRRFNVFYGEDFLKDPLRFLIDKIATK